MCTEDERFMRIALTCAAHGRGLVEPNPMVGAVIVRDGRELGRGWHERFGGPHAEIRALHAARGDVRGATMYVTLEPCSHHGKTPPCADALIAAGIARVVAAMGDPDENVSGRGFAKLRDAGVDVTVGVLGDDARRLLRAYCKLRTTARPWVICKWAQTPDGLIALPASAGRWISGQLSRQYVHEVRGYCQGILVGVGTVLADDPLLTNRSGRGRQPTRVVLDSKLRLPPTCQLVRTAAESPVIAASTVAENTDHADKLLRAGVELLELPATADGVDLPALLDELGRREWTHLLVEGGATVLTSFIYHGLADEAIVFVNEDDASQISSRRAGIKSQRAPLARFDIADVREKLALQPIEQRRFGNDVMTRYLLARRSLGEAGRSEL